MIAKLSTNVKELIRQKRESERFRNELHEIESTISELNGVQTQAAKLLNIYKLVYSRLSPTKKKNVEERVFKLVNQIRNSRQDFSSTRRQFVALKNARDNIISLTSETEVIWKLDITELLKPFFELYNIVKQLPDFKAQEEDLALLRNRLAYFQDNVPKNIIEVREFEQKLAQFSLGLSRIPGLTPKIQGFLTKVVKQTATLDDMDEEILAWCRQAGRSKVFQIQFRS